MENKGLIHIYTGDGKGKTTAAVGLAVRASGAKKKVLFCQFLKGRDTSELAPLKTLGIELMRAEKVQKFFQQMSEEEKKICVKSHQLCYNTIKDKMLSSFYDMIIIDEAFAAIHFGLIDAEELLYLARQKPQSLELVFTGRNAPKEFIALADYVSQIKEVKHPYQKGISARKGIEY